MSCLGVLFALTPDEQRTLLDLEGDDDALRQYVQEVIEENKLGGDDESDCCELGLAWDALHRCLNRGRLTPLVTADPAARALLGGRWMHRADNYIVCLNTPAEVPRVAAALAAIPEHELGKLFDALPDDYDGPHDDEDRAYTWECFLAMKEFYIATAARGLAVIFTADQ